MSALATFFAVSLALGFTMSMLASIVISLKRIADALENPARLMDAATEWRRQQRPL